MEILVLGMLILLNGVFALSEIALVSSRKSKLRELKQNGSQGARVALELLENSERFLSAIQVGITLIGIVTGVYGGINIADDLTPFFERFEPIRTFAHEIALTLTVILITYVSIVIGELVPKTLAMSKPERIAVRIAPLIFYFSKAFGPFVWFLSFSTQIVNQVLGVKKPVEQLTEAELRQMIKTASTEGVIEKEQNILHEKVFYFADKRARHIMTHRTEVEWVDISRPAAETEQALASVQHSKIVCCRGDLDHFVGILYLRDYYKSLTSNKRKRISDLLISPLIVPESADAQTVLALLRQKKTHFCLVVNEYGGFEGLITLQDIVENIVGHIPDEGEVYEPDVFVREDKSVLISGDAPIESLTDIIEGFTIDFEEIDYATVAGFVFNQMDKIPQIGDKFSFMGYSIEVVDIDGNRIDKILVTKK